MSSLVSSAQNQFCAEAYQYRVGTGLTFSDRTGPTGYRPVQTLDLTGKKPVKNRPVTILDFTGVRPVHFMHHLNN
jgi:hypothetical protein